jgi:hypothetical protein
MLLTIGVRLFPFCIRLIPLPNPLEDDEEEDEEEEEEEAEAEEEEEEEAGAEEEEEEEEAGVVEAFASLRAFFSTRSRKEPLSARGVLPEDIALGGGSARVPVPRIRYDVVSGLDVRQRSGHLFAFVSMLSSPKYVLL